LRGVDEAISQVAIALGKVVWAGAEPIAHLGGGIIGSEGDVDVPGGGKGAHLDFNQTPVSRRCFFLAKIAGEAGFDKSRARRLEHEADVHWPEA